MADINENKNGCPCPPPYPPYPPYPPFPPYPPHPPVPPCPPEPPVIRSMDIILTKKLNNVLYELIVKTRANMVYTDESDTETLTERLSAIADALISLKDISDTFDNYFAKLMKDAPETFRTFKEVWDYVNVNGDPESELIKLIKSKQDAEEGKGLSTHDLTDILYEKLVNGYTAEELDAKFKIVINNEENIVQSMNKMGSELSDKIDSVHGALDTKINTSVNELNTRINETSNALNARINETSNELNTRINETSNALNARINETSNELNSKIDKSVEELTNEIREVDNKPNIVLSDELPDIPDYSTWYKVISIDTEN